MLLQSSGMCHQDGLQAVMHEYVVYDVSLQDLWKSNGQRTGISISQWKSDQTEIKGMFWQCSLNANQA